jgi:hypothetical protein
MLGRRGTAAVRDVALAGRAGACAARVRRAGMRVHASEYACRSAREHAACGCARGARVWGLVGVSGLQAEGYGDGFGGFDGVAVEGGGLVTPLADGVRGGGD